jgi:endonuclease YncB( thermonuclease family)
MAATQILLPQGWNRYGRILGKVWVNGVDACLEQVKAGFAWHFKEYQHEQSMEDQRLYADAKNDARDARLGLWRENDPIPPWEHRRLYR